MSDEDADRGAASEDAFALVGNEIRAEIVRTVGDARIGTGSPRTLSFSELRSRADVDVGSSRFNYHLQKLVGHFLERTDEGYRLRPEGRPLYHALRAGTFDRRASLPAVEVGVDCYYCGAAVEASYNDGAVVVQCPDCEYLYDVATAPPGAVEDGEVALSQVARYNHHAHLGFASGVCPTCANDLHVQFLPPEEAPFPGDGRHEVYVYLSCERCDDQRYLSVGEALLRDAGLLSFCHERGLDALSTPLWEIEFAATDRHVTVRSTDPWEVALSVTLDGVSGEDAESATRRTAERTDVDTLELVVDGDLNVVERNRR